MKLQGKRPGGLMKKGPSFYNPALCIFWMPYSCSQLHIVNSLPGYPTTSNMKGCNPITLSIYVPDVFVGHFFLMG